MIRVLQRRVRPRAGLVLGAVLLGTAYLVARLIGVGDSATLDEVRWMARSANYYQAWSSGDLQHTFQFAHPGVMTTVAGMLGYLVVFPDYPAVAGGQLSRDGFLVFDATLRGMGRDPMDILTSLRISKILVSSVFFLISLGLLRRFVPSHRAQLLALCLALAGALAATVRGIVELFA